MKLLFSSNIRRNTVFEKTSRYLIQNNLRIIDKDESRPWGGFFVIDENQATNFIDCFFSKTKTDINTEKKLSPKILIVQPGKRLSWQYHFRREELWKVIGGDVGIITSETDEETAMKQYSAGAVIKLKQGERHRLIGLNSWGIIAEIWQHTDYENASNEDDIVRVQDDFGR